MAKVLKNSVYDMRTKKGITQQDLAEAVEVTRQTVIAIERGNYTPSVALALALARYFRCSVEELFYN